METLKLKRKAERSHLTRLLNDIEAALAHESVTEVQLCIFNERLNQLHTDLRATYSDIVPLLSTTEAGTEFERVVDYNDRAKATSTKLKHRLRQFQESQNHALPTTPTDPYNARTSLPSSF
ncbi:hypothetical protein HPB52_010396 [Rhipicephalus sanguineus]|uniref:Uncharacterized protein n=1 Tax=Rhipicephalus sanguineus TaxID=34632 RepID=A0A9D4Q9J6_RHISA|nr:hypothetical protein HPB52_010396 [Rhipicephalus sanguineus]